MELRSAPDMFQSVFCSFSETCFLVIGDSFAYWAGRRCAFRVPAQTAGWRGGCISDDRFRRWAVATVLRLRPQRVLLIVGSNELARVPFSPRHHFGLFRELTLGLLAAGAEEIHVFPVPPRTSTRFRSGLGLSLPSAATTRQHAAASPVCPASCRLARRLLCVSAGGELCRCRWRAPLHVLAGRPSPTWLRPSLRPRRLCAPADCLPSPPAIRLSGACLVLRRIHAVA